MQQQLLVVSPQQARLCPSRSSHIVISDFEKRFSEAIVISKSHPTSHLDRSAQKSPAFYPRNPAVILLHRSRRSQYWSILLWSYKGLNSASQRISAYTVTLASPSPPAAGGAAAPKRKRIPGEIKYYAVRKGYNPGIYTTWKECLGQVTGFKGATFKSFSSEADAKLFMDGHDPTLDPNSSVYVEKWYGVRSGKCPGVYPDWKSASAQVIGWQKPKVKSFATREEAEAFVASGPGIPSSPIPEDRKTRNKDSATKKGPTTSTTTTVTKKRKGLGTASILSMDNLTETMDLEKALEAEIENMDKALRPEGVNNDNDDADGHKAKKLKTKNVPPAKKGSVLRIYTDGSALSNGRDEATAGVGVWFGSNDSRNISEPLTGPRQTNQRAELMAIFRAIEIAPKHREVLIFSDSQYAINCVSLWHHNWSRNGWMTSLGKKVENQDIIEEILDKIQEREEIGAKTSFEWVKGHTGAMDGNTYADKLAQEGARKGKLTNASRR